MSKLTEEIKRLSRKIDNIDQRVEKIEESQLSRTIKVGEEIVKDNTPKVGDFCIFWDENHEMAVCDILHEKDNSTDYPFSREDFWYKNCVKFESEEQFRKIKEGKI